MKGLNTVINLIARLLEAAARVGFQIGHKRALQSPFLAKLLVMELIGEQLRYPLFDAAEFEKKSGQSISSRHGSTSIAESA
jgi:hypothetical protein